MIKSISCWLILLPILLTSCGFQLRGSLKEDLASQNVYIKLDNSEALEQDIYFRSQLERYLSLYNLDNSSAERLELVIHSIEKDSYTSAINLNREETTAELTLTIGFTLNKAENGVSNNYQIQEQQFLSSAPADPNTSEAQALLINQEMDENAARKVTEVILNALSNPAWQFRHAKP